MKNKILKGITIFMFIMMFMFAACLDSEDITIPVVGMCICFIWLYPFAMINRGKWWFR